MSVKVIKNRVFDGVKTYEVDDVIEGLSENDKSQLVSDGIVEYIGTRPEIKKYKLVNNINKKVETLVNSVGTEDDLKGDTETDPIDELKLSEGEKPSIEGEEKLSDLIDPNSFALNSDDYLKASAPKGKKEKAI
jgi:hypothetical protein